MELNIPAKYQKDIETATNLLKNEGCQSTTPPQADGVCCSRKVFDSGYIPLVPPQGAGVCTLRNESIFLFGSLVTGKTHDDSDIDIGIKGLPKGKFFEVYSRLYFDIENKIDLVDFDTNSDFYSMLKRIGEVIQIG
jgi:predicted nucleotidyltransferase